MTFQHTVRRVVVLASGTGTLLQAIIDAAHDSDNNSHQYIVVGVVSDQHCPAIERAQRHGIATEVVELGADRQEWDRELRVAVDKHEPDLVVSAGFMRILGREFLERFEGRTINTHPALLPAFPGAHAVRDALAYGVKITGATVHFVDEGVDTGPIIAQAAVTIHPDDTEQSLHERIKEVERKLIVTVLKNERFVS